MSIDRETIRGTVERLMPSAAEFLAKLISFPSTSGKEHELMCWAEGAFRELGVEVTRVPLSDAILDDEDYSSPIPDLHYDGRFNLRLRVPGSGRLLQGDRHTFRPETGRKMSQSPPCGRTLILNTHTDVVPPSQGQERPFEAVESGGIIHGRGACDAKGQVATIYLVLAALARLNVKPAGDLVVHLVVEEENGGNGTLAMVRAGEKADGCVVMEPTSGKIYSSVRGAVWFRLLCEGKPGHSGRAGETISALSLARNAMDVLETYHRELLAASRRQVRKPHADHLRPPRRGRLAGNCTCPSDPGGRPGALAQQDQARGDGRDPPEAGRRRFGAQGACARGVHVCLTRSIRWCKSSSSAAAAGASLPRSTP